MRNVLIITVGHTPQIVTETLYALLGRQGRNGPFIPDSIYLVTTAAAAPAFEALRSVGGMLSALYQQFSVGDRFVPPEIVQVQDKDLKPVSDVRSVQEAVAFGNSITRLVAKIARDPATRIHVSLAGGRKTMSWYAGSALSLFGREQDELSHVLVEPEELEQCPDFWWPTTSDRIVAHKFQREPDGKPKQFNARVGRIDLALIPFVRLSPLLSGEPFKGDPDYEPVVQDLDAAVRALAPVRLRIDVERREVWVGGERIELPHRSFALYALLAEARKMKWAASTATTLGAEHFGWMTLRDFNSAESPYLRRYFELLSGCHTGATASAEELIDEAAAELNVDAEDFLARMRTIKSRVSGGKTGAFRQQISNPQYLQRVKIENVRLKTGEQPFGLLLDPRQIEFAGPP